MRFGTAMCALAVASCHGVHARVNRADLLGSAPQPPDAAAPAAPDAGPTAPPSWTFAVLSDLHLPNDAPATATTARVIAAVVALHPRFVVITGDSTNGSPNGPVGRRWWPTVKAALQPLRDAGIPILPVAGNHDVDGAVQRAGYAAAWTDLSTWAAPLALEGQPPDGKASLGREPFVYSVDVDGIHLALAHVVNQALDKDVAAWLASDLASAPAASASVRMVFGHVPMSSVIAPHPNANFLKSFGAILEAGHADWYVSGHEHLVWDEDVALPGGGTVRQEMVGCSSGFYNYGPSKDSRTLAGCVQTSDGLRCRMPHGGGGFTLGAGRKGRLIQQYRNSFTMFTVRGADVSAEPLTVDETGQVEPFYLPPPEFMAWW